VDSDSILDCIYHRGNIIFVAITLDVDINSNCGILRALDNINPLDTF
jgi:hypothetical protein